MERWNIDGRRVLVKQRNGDGGTAWWNSGIVMVEQCKWNSETMMVEQ